MTNDMFQLLREINRRPEPFDTITTEALWSDEHTSAEMLKYHLDGTVDVASRRTEFLDRSAQWIMSRFELAPGKSVADFGCGPGLYTSRLARSGAQIIGIDFSQRSLKYAREQAERSNQSINYVCADYLTVNLRQHVDLITMIMCDYCALSPPQRSMILQQFAGHLKPGGCVLLDVYSMNAFAEKAEKATYAPNLLNGFFAANPYFGFLNTFKYEDERVMLDKYTIIEASRTRVFYNWLQYYAQEALASEFAEQGLTVVEFLGNVAGSDFDESADEFAVIAKPAV